MAADRSEEVGIATAPESEKKPNLLPAYFYAGKYKMGEPVICSGLIGSKTDGEPPLMIPESVKGGDLIIIPAKAKGGIRIAQVLKSEEMGNSEQPEDRRLVKWYEGGESGTQAILDRENPPDVYLINPPPGAIWRQPSWLDQRPTENYDLPAY